MKLNELFEEKEFLVRTEDGYFWSETIVPGTDENDVKSKFKKGLPRGTKIKWVREKRPGDTTRSSLDYQEKMPRAIK